MKTIELKEQMEMGLVVTRANRRFRRSKNTTRKAGWWFSQMRQAVDRAIDWTPRPAPRASQVYFSLERQTTNW